MIDEGFLKILTYVFFAIIIISLIGYVVMGIAGLGYWKEHSTTDCVKDKWVKGSESQTYLIGMVSGDVYKIADSYFKWQWRSSDIYNTIDEGQCYKIQYYGWRIGFFSNYPNIIEVQEVPRT